MPEINILFSRTEDEGIVRHVLSLGGWLVPSSLDSLRLLRINDIAGYRKRFDQQERLFHIQHKSFDLAPLEVRHALTHDGRNIWYVAQRNGGPTVDLLGPYDFDDGGRHRIAGGFLGHYPTFWNPNVRANQAATTTQKEFYGALLRHIRANALKTRAGKRTCWIGRTTATDLKAGLVTLPASWQLAFDPQTLAID